MAKWSRLESVLKPFAMAKQAYENGNTEEAQSFAKRGTEMIDAMVKMAQLKQTIDMAPYEVDYKKALSEQAYGAAKEAGQRAETGAFKLEQDKKAQEALAPMADALSRRFNLDRDEVYNIMLSGQDIGKISKDFGTMAQTGERFGQGYYPAETKADVTKFVSEASGNEYLDTLNKLRQSENVATPQIGAEKAGFETKTAFTYPLESEKLAQEKIKTKYMPEEYESQAWARRHPQSSTTATQPINIADKARDNIMSIERQETNIYNALARLDALYESGESNIFQQFKNAMPSTAADAPDVSGKDREVQYAELKKYYTNQLSSVRQTKNYWVDLEKQGLSQMGITIPEPTKALPATPMRVTAQRWDSMRDADKNGYRSYRGGILIETPTGAIPINEYEKRKSQTPTSSTTQSKPATKTEQPQKTGNTNTEKKATSLEEWKKRRDKQ